MTEIRAIDLIDKNENLAFRRKVLCNGLIVEDIYDHVIGISDHEIRKIDISQRTKYLYSRFFGNSEGVYQSGYFDFKEEVWFKNDELCQIEELLNKYGQISSLPMVALWITILKKVDLHYKVKKNSFEHKLGKIIEFLSNKNHFADDDVRGIPGYTWSDFVIGKLKIEYFKQTDIYNVNISNKKVEKKTNFEYTKDTNIDSRRENDFLREVGDNILEIAIRHSNIIGIDSDLKMNEILVSRFVNFFKNHDTRLTEKKIIYLFIEIYEMLGYIIQVESMIDKDGFGVSLEQVMEDRYQNVKQWLKASKAK